MDKKQRVFLLFGESGSGKSSFINYISKTGSDKKNMAIEGDGLQSCTDVVKDYYIKKSILGIFIYLVIKVMVRRCSAN